MWLLISRIRSSNSTWFTITQKHLFLYSVFYLSNWMKCRKTTDETAEGRDQRLWNHRADHECLYQGTIRWMASTMIPPVFDRCSIRRHRRLFLFHRLKIIPNENKLINKLLDKGKSKKDEKKNGRKETDNIFKRQFIFQHYYHYRHYAWWSNETGFWRILGIPNTVVLRY